MKRILAITLSAAFLALGAADSRAGFDEGFAAFDRHDYETAYREWLSAAERGDPHSQNMLGLLIRALYGTAPGPDGKTGIYWIRKAAEQGQAWAQYNLGSSLSGPEAFKWIYESAQKGFPDAQVKLSRFYRDGQNVPEDVVKAYIWASRAASVGHRAATALRADLAKSMTPSQMAEAEMRGVPEVPAGAHAARKVSRAEQVLSSPSAEARPQTKDMGSVGNRIATVQRQLAMLGYDPGPADGVLGSKTRAAIRKFQARESLPVTGNISKALEAVLQSAVNVDSATLKAARRAVQSGSPGSSSGVARGHFRSQRGAYKQALKEWLPLAEAGHPVLQCMVGLMYQIGLGVPRNKAKARYWIERSAKNGNSKAQAALAEAYARGSFVEKDWGKSEYWLRKSAEQGNADSQFGLGIYNTLLHKNYPEAIKWFRKAAEQGHIKAQLELGSALLAGIGTAQDIAAGRRWLLKAAKRGYAKAQFTLGQFYSLKKWAPPDDKEALKWYLRAAKQGHKWAQIAVGLIYYHGRGIPRNRVLAYMWISLAAAQGDENSAKALIEIEPLLTEWQIAQARRLALAFEPRKEILLKKEPLDEASRTGKDGLRLVSSGSGFIVNRDGYIVTNRHVAEGCKRLTVSGGAEAKRVAIDTTIDLALLETGTKFATAITFRDYPPVRSGEDIIVLGFPLPGMLTTDVIVTKGSVSALAGGPGNDRRFMQISAPIQPGNSGGPVLDMSGNLVGVVVATLNAAAVAQLSGSLPQNVNFAIALEEVRSLLRAHDVPYVTRESKSSLKAPDVVEEAERYTVQIDCWK